ncbi:hypothetical protein BDZ88DRAFT_442168 [Geranomyces variabilis]|nr:hypothetical protein BDZ88DRAFT_442168 [Geranomyces variabilis]KAJ3138244.1 hypothetical protein HDU90_001206 [Geranomyces variabilis]
MSDLPTYVGFPDLNAEIGSPGNEALVCRHTEAEPAANDHRPCEHSGVSARSLDWINDKKLIFDVVTRFVRDPFPKTVLERRFGLRLRQFVYTKFDESRYTWGTYADEYEKEAHTGFWDPHNTMNGDRYLPTQHFADFDLVNGGTVHELRMAYNEGSADLNTQLFFTIRVECLDRNLMNAWVPVTDLAPLVFSRSDEHEYYYDENSAICACGKEHDRYSRKAETHGRLISAGVDRNDKELLRYGK